MKNKILMILLTAILLMNIASAFAENGTLMDIDDSDLGRFQLKVMAEKSGEEPVFQAVVDESDPVPVNAQPLEYDQMGHVIVIDRCFYTIKSGSPVYMKEESLISIVEAYTSLLKRGESEQQEKVNFIVLQIAIQHHEVTCL